MAPATKKELGPAGLVAEHSLYQAHVDSTAKQMFAELAQTAHHPHPNKSNLILTVRQYCLTLTTTKTPEMTKRSTREGTAKHENKTTMTIGPYLARILLRDSQMLDLSKGSLLCECWFLKSKQRE